MLRVVTFNVLTLADANGPRRQPGIRRTLARLRPDIVALQETIRGEGTDQPADLLGGDFTIVDLPRQRADSTGDVLASRWPVTRVSTLDIPVAGGKRATAVAAEIDVPGPVGAVLAVHHRATFELPLEQVREQQASATARFVEEIVAGRDIPVVLLGDLNAAPDAASIRFLAGKQSLDGASVRYEDAWPAVHGDAAGHTFTPRNPLVRAGELPLERGRRIDYVMVRSGSYGPPLDVADCQLVFTDPVDGVWVSDHFGVLADLRPPPHPLGEWADSPPPTG